MTILVWFQQNLDIYRKQFKKREAEKLAIWYAPIHRVNFIEGDGTEHVKNKGVPWRKWMEGHKRFRGWAMYQTVRLYWSRKRACCFSPNSSEKTIERTDRNQEDISTRTLWLIVWCSFTSPRRRRDLQYGEICSWSARHAIYSHWHKYFLADSSAARRRLTRRLDLDMWYPGKFR